MFLNCRIRLLKHSMADCSLRLKPAARWEPCESSKWGNAWWSHRADSQLDAKRRGCHTWLSFSTLHVSILDYLIRARLMVDGKIFIAWIIWYLKMRCAFHICSFSFNLQKELFWTAHLVQLTYAFITCLLGWRVKVTRIWSLFVAFWKRFRANHRILT